MSNPLRNKLYEQIENLYDVFAEYPLPESAKCRKGASRKQYLRTLFREDILGFGVGIDVLLGIDALRDENYKAIMPRVLELRLDTYFEPEYRKLNFRGLHDCAKWTNYERRAIHNYLIVLWKYVLSEYPAPFREEIFEELVCGLSHWGDHFPTFLKMWEDAMDQRNVSALRHLADFARNGYGYLCTMTSTRREYLHTWMCRQETVEYLTNAYLKYENEAFAEEFSQGADELTKRFWFWRDCAPDDPT